jgi:hypothetical protein
VTTGRSRDAAAPAGATDAGPVPGDDRPTQRPDLRVRAVESEVLVLDHAARRIHQLNTTAGFVWQRCDGRHTLGDIADDLARSFRVDPETARGAVVDSLGRFTELGLLQPDLD